jgi:cyanate permease
LMGTIYDQTGSYAGGLIALSVVSASVLVFTFVIGGSRASARKA